MICFPCAKINIGLNVTGLLEDGYHSIETLMYPLGLSDVLEVVESKNTTNTLVLGGLEMKDTPMQANLCLKAYNLLKKDYPILPSVNIYLHKCIPLGAGLGGGSSDATATIKSLSSLFHLDMSLAQIEHYGSLLGADCAFFAYNIPLYAYEKGDRFSQTTLSLRGYRILLVKPDVFISTKEAYDDVTIRSKESSLLNTLESKPAEQWRYFLENDFEQSVFAKYPVLGDIKQSMYDLGALYAQMSGSGATIYGIFDRDITPDEINLFPYPFVHWEVLK